MGTKQSFYNLWQKRIAKLIKNMATNTEADSKAIVVMRMLKISRAIKGSLGKRLL